MTQWIRDRTRAKVYLRDTPPGQKSPACVYCGRAVLIGRLPSDTATGLAAAVIDHVDPDVTKKPNDPKKLVTACWSCNNEKGKRSPEEWEDHRCAQDLPSRPPWRSNRPEPVGTLRARVNTATGVPLCFSRDPVCAAAVEEVDDRRTAAAYSQRRRRS